MSRCSYCGSNTEAERDEASGTYTCDECAMRRENIHQVRDDLAAVAQKVRGRAPKTIKVGDLVDYHAVIGGPITLRRQTVKAIAYRHEAYGRDVAWITGKAGCVALLALSPAEEESSWRPIVWTFPQPKAVDREPGAGEMRWICLDCRQAKRESTFVASSKCAPVLDAGCPRCGSKRLVDCNVTFVGVVKLKGRD